MLGFGLGLNKWRRVGGGYVGLLDLYPNAAAAYSLRKLRAAYSGSAVRVRKEVSSVSSETDIGFLADGSLDTVSLLAFASDADSGDVFVVTWYDQSLSNDATQSTAAAQPKIVSGGSLVTENGKPAVDFDGVDDYLRNTDLISNQPTTHHLVAKANNIGILTRFTDGGVNSSSRNSIYQNVSSFQYFSGNNLTGDLENTNQNLHYYLVNGVSSEIAINGAAALTGDSGGYDLNGITFGARWDGAAQFSDVIIQELIIYPSDQSSNRTAIETNINTFYSIYP